MPVYQIQGKDGRLYRIQGPAGLSREQVIAAVLDRAPEAGQPRQEESPIEKIPVVGGGLSAVADIPLGLVSGVAGTGETIAESLGAENFLGGALGDLSEGARGLMSKEAREDYIRDMYELEKAEGIGETIGAAGRAFMRHPLDVGSQLLGSSIPFVGAALAGGVPAALAVGAASGAGMIKGDIYDAVLNRAIGAGVPEDKAAEIAEKAQEYGGENTDMISLGATIGAVASATGVTPRLARMIGVGAAKETAERIAARAAQGAAQKGFLRRTGEGVVTEAIPEGLQAAQQQYAQNLGQERAGFPTDTGEGVLEQGVYEGTLAGILGGGVGMFDTGRPQAAPATEEELAAEAEVGTVIAEAFADDPDLSDVQKATATQNAARMVVKQGIRIEDAMAVARDEQVKAAELAAKRAKREAADAGEPAVEGVDLGGGELGVPSTDGGLGGESAVEAGGTGPGRVGTAGPAAGQPDVREGTGDAALVKARDKVERALSGLAFNFNEEQKAEAARRVAAGADVIDTLADIDEMGITPVSAAPAAAPKGKKTKAKVEEAAPVKEAPELTVASYVDRYLAGEGRGDTETDLELQQFAANNATDIEAEFRRRQEEQKTESTQERAPPVNINPKLPEDVQAAQLFVNQVKPGFEVRYTPGIARPYSYAVPGQKKKIKSFRSVKALKTYIASDKEPGLTPKKETRVVEVKKIPAAPARGLEKKQPKDIMSRDEIGGDKDVAGKLNAAQEAQVALLNNEIDAARKRREITDFERSELVEMLRTPDDITEAAGLLRKGQDPALAMALRAKADPTWLAASDLQAEIDRLTKEGRELRTQELQLKESTGRSLKKAKESGDMTKEEKKLLKQIEDVAARTKRAGDELLTAKKKIYSKVKISLANKRVQRKRTLAKLEADFKAGKISERVYRIMKRENTPEAMRYRKGRGKAEGISLEALNSAVKDITSRWKVALDAKLVQSINDLPQSIRSALEADERTDAFGFYKDGEVYLIADNMHSVDDVAPTLFHEALGHLGLRRLFREGLDDALLDIYESNKKVRDATDQWMRENPNQYANDEDPLARAVEEVLAEASEGGPLRASMMAKISRYIKDFVRRVFGINLNMTDGEVDTILAIAHEQAIENPDDPAVGSSSTMYARKARAKQDKADKDATEAAEESITAMERIQTSIDRIDEDEFFSGVSSSIKARNVKRFVKGLSPKRLYSRFLPQGGLDAMPSDGLLDYGDTLLGKENTTGLHNAMNAMEDLNAYRATIRRTQAKITEAIADFINKFGKNILADSLFFADDYNMDLTKFTDGMTLQEAYKTDNVWNWYTKKLADPALEAKKRTEYEKLLKKRKGEIKEGFDAWQALGKLEGGHELFLDISQSFRDMYNTRRFLMRKYIESQKAAGMSDEAVASLMESYELQFERLNETINAPDPEDRHKDYKDVPLGVFYRQYMPRRRFDNFWLRIKKTKFGEPILYFFDSKAERDEVWEATAKQMGVDPDNSAYFDLGNNVEMDLSDLRGVNTDTAFNKALNIIASIDPKNITEATKNRLQNDVYQLFLLSAPEGSVRKSFIKTNKRLGWSSDLLRVFNGVAEEYASDIARLTYAPEIDRNLKEFEDRFDLVDRREKKKDKDTEEPDEEEQTAAGEPMSTSNKAIARDFLNNVQRRITGTMQPQAEGLVNKIVPWMNQLAFVSFLTAPATAIVQVTALPIRVAPHLYGKYGLAETTKVMARYMPVFNNRPRFMGKGTEKRKSFRIATLREAPGVKNVKHRAEALKWATDRGLTMPISEYLMGQERTPTSAAQGRTKEAVQKAYDAMTYLFDTTEQMTREITFLSAYDLEYDKLKDSGLAEVVRQEKAREAARYVVNYTLGDYSNLNRPLLFKSSELAKAFFLFKMYSAVTTRFFVTNFRAIIGADKSLTAKERVAAGKELFGVLSMGFMFGGMTGLPLYTMGMGLLQMLQDATDDDEDRRQRMKEDPITANSVEAQFRYNWLPEHFGEPMVQGKDGNNYSLSDIILNGPISEMSGWNFGSRVSLDLVGLWFRAPKDADNWKTTVNNALVENIPGASASLNLVDMGEQFAKGDVNKALQVGMPAMFKAWAKAYEMKTEGIRTQTGKVKLAADELSNMDEFGAYLGFNPTEVAKLQRQNRDVTSRVKELKEDKKKLVGAYTQAVRRINTGDPNGYEMLNDAAKDIIKYNQKIGNLDFAITDVDVIRSLRSAAGEEKGDIAGMGLTEKEAKYVKKTLRKE